MVVEIDLRELGFVVVTVKRDLGDRRVMHQILVSKGRRGIHQPGQQVSNRGTMAHEDDVFAGMIAAPALGIVGEGLEREINREGCKSIDISAVVAVKYLVLSVLIRLDGIWRGA